MVARPARAPLPTEPVAILASPPPSPRLTRRAVRVGFGQGLIVGAVVAVVGWAVTVEYREPKNVLFAGIVGAWVLGALGALVGRVVVDVPSVRRSLGDDGLGVASFVVPAVGVALVGPLSLQAIIGTVPVLLGANFDAWAFFALVGTAHVHVAFAIAMGLMAARIARGEAPTQATLWPAVLLSLFPGAMLLFPPLLVWATGLGLSWGFAAQARRWFVDDGAVERV